MLPLIGSLIGSGASLLGGLFGQENQASINSQNVAAQEQINSQNIANQQAINNQNIAEQEKFAQNGVQWRVADANAAGINPLAALGAQTASFSNQVGTTLQAPKMDASNSFGTGVAQAGQDIGRAIAATRSPEEQAIAITKTQQDLEQGQLQNELLKSQIFASNVATHVKAAGLGGGVPKAGQGVVSQFPMGDDGVPQQYPGRDIEGAAWIDPWAKMQYLVGHQLEPMFGFNVPAKIRAIYGDGAKRNPFTGGYYSSPTLDGMGNRIIRGQESMFPYGGMIGP